MLKDVSMSTELTMNFRQVDILFYLLLPFSRPPLKTSLSLSADLAAASARATTHDQAHGYGHGQLLQPTARAAASSKSALTPAPNGGIYYNYNRNPNP